MKDYAKLYEELTEPREPVDLINLQISLEHKYNKKQKYKIIREGLKEVIEPMKDEIINSFKEEGLNWASEILYILVQRQTITFNYLIPMIIERFELDLSYSKIVAELIYKGNGSLWNISKDRYTRVHNLWELDEETLERINEFRFLSPMIVKPLEVNHRGNNKGSGYLTIGSDSLLLGGQYHTKDICTNVLNQMNSTKFELNIELMKLFRNSWKHMQSPKLADGIEQLRDETEEEYKKRLEAFEQYEQLVFKTAIELYHCDNQFYFTHKYDKRGRLYCMGYQLSYQSNSYGKAILNLAKKEVVEDTINFFE